MSDEHEFKILNDEGDVLFRVAIPVRVPVEIQPAEAPNPNGDRWAYFTNYELDTIAIGLLNANTHLGDGIYLSLREEQAYRRKVKARSAA